jgi:ABC-2 type transport system permease protein
MKIAGRELKTLFCSPVAWVILALFFFQAALSFTNLLDIIVQQQFSRPLWYSVAGGVFSRSTGMILPMQGYLYLYVPLVTMGLVSREYGSGTIKLLYSSPVTTFQIVAGKFLSMMIYGTLLVSIFLLMLLFLAWRVPHLDAGIAWSGIAATYLLVITYAAIGLFVSCLTSYQIVAAIGTLAVLAFLDQAGSLGQHVDFLRDVAYWLSLRGRSEEMVNGLVRGEDVCYFLLVILLFFSLAILQINSRKDRAASPLVAAGRHVAVIVIVLLAGYISALPRLGLFLDTTATGSNTLARESREIVERLTGGLTITTYVNLLDENFREGMPENRNVDKRRFARYTRFKPDIEMKYVYYYADPVTPGKQPPAGDARERAWQKATSLELAPRRFLPLGAIDPGIDLAAEGYRFVRVIQRASGEKSVLRLFADSRKHPTEYEISTALKRLVVPPPRVLFLAGGGERDINKQGDEDYYLFANSRSFRHSLVNSGFDVKSVSRGQPVDAGADILVVAAPRAPLLPADLAEIDRFLAGGGNMLVLVDPDTRANVEPLVHRLGVYPRPAPLLQPPGAFDEHLVTCYPTPGAARVSSTFRELDRQRYCVTLPGALALDHDTLHGYRVTPFLRALPAPPGDEEAKEAPVTMLALSRPLPGDREQRVAIIGNADCIGNAELQMQRPGLRASNFSLVTGTFRWLTRDEFPMTTTRPAPPDTLLRLSRDDMPRVKLLFLGVIPSLVLLAGGFNLFRRKRR